MDLTVDLKSPVPVYEQIRSQITEMVELGTLSAGPALPTVRQLAADLGIAPGTVARCYQELRLQGVVSGGRRHGTRVADVHVLPPAARHSRLADAAARLVGSARRLGADDQGIRAAVSAALERALPDA
ncbi:MAG: GntR family transcriptional regulator [Candidatus Dormibacteria bacterium]